MNIKTIAAALLAGVTSTAAFAADLPSRKVAPAYVAPAPIFTWSGFYIGAQIGYAWDKVKVDNGWMWGLTSLDRNGVVGGGHVGYLFQTNSGFVLGVEGDIEGTSVKNSNLRASVRGRLGFGIDRALIYATGGLAIANDNTVWGWGWSNNSTTRVGWTAGAGVEYAFSPNWSGRVEYRYSDFGRKNVDGWGVWNGSFNTQRTEHAVRVGVSYHFNTAGAYPVVAKY